MICTVALPVDPSAVPGLLTTPTSTNRRLAYGHSYVAFAPGKLEYPGVTIRQYWALYGRF
jgi:hypothetical protein